MTTRDYGMVRSVGHLEELFGEIAESNDLIGFDLETGYDGPERLRGGLAIHWDRQFITGFSFTTSPTWARYVPLRHEFGVSLDEDEVWPIVKPVLEQKRIVAHQAKFEKRNMRKVGIELGVAHCTLIQAFVLSEFEPRMTGGTGIGLKALVKEVFGHEMADIHSLYPDLPDNRRDHIRFNALDLTPEVVEYACEDASWCLALHERNYPRIEGSDQAFVYRLELAIMNILCDMEDRGVAVDWAGMERAYAEAVPFLARMEQEVTAELSAMAGRSLVGLKLNSPKQLRDLLYGELGFATSRKTKSGDAMSTDAVALEKLSREVPAVRKLLESREVRNMVKRLGLWLETPDEKRGRWSRTPMRGPDDRIHANYAQTVVGTGRFAANDPPIQQCPKDWYWGVGKAARAYAEAQKQGLGHREAVQRAQDAAQSGEVFVGNFRDFIVAEPDHYLLGFDYSQIELRVLAGLSQEQPLLDAFDNDEDVHTLTAALMLGKRPEDVDRKSERQIGKTLNFALLYGMGAQSLSERLAVTKDRADELFSAYFAGYPGVATWAQEMRNVGMARRHTLSWIKRKYRVWELDSDSGAMRAKGERVLVNAPVQGGAADYVKIAMVKAEKALRRQGWWGTKVFMVMNQHDALTFEVSQELDPHEVMAILRPEVEFDPRTLVKDVRFPKIVTDWEFGYRWGSSTPVGPQTLFVRDEDGAWQVEGEKPAVPLHVVRDPAEEPEVHEVHEVHEERIVQEADVLSGRTLVVELVSMPTRSQMMALLELIGAHPGRNKVRLTTPQGHLEAEFPGTSLSVVDGGRIATAIPGARTYYPAEEVNVSAVTAGMTW